MNEITYLLLGFSLCMLVVGLIFGTNKITWLFSDIKFLKKEHGFRKLDLHNIQKEFDNVRLIINKHNADNQAKFENYDFLLKAVINSQSDNHSEKAKENPEEKENRTLWNDPKAIRETIKNIKENLELPDDEEFRGMTPNDAYHELSDRLEILNKNA